MKFLCDRCKTRYSIADERVRGKILKIRCKNCSNVITVREGMPEPEAESPTQAESRRQLHPTDYAPAIVGAAPPKAAPAPSLQAAFAQAMDKPAAPPPQLEEEWYVSIDGDQQGPFTLPDAQAWIKGKRADDELFCWCEGFDDWLPVEKVSHFRGLRVKKAPPRPPTARPVAPMSPAPPPPEEPKPLFAAALAALEADVAASTAAEASASGPAPLPLMSAGTSARRVAPSPSTAPQLAKATPLTGTPAARSAFDFEEEKSDLGPVPLPPPTRAPAIPLADLARVPAPAPLAAAPPDPGPATVPVNGHDADPPADDFAIGEVSRVVRLADIVRATPKAAKPARGTMSAPVVREQLAEAALPASPLAQAAVDSLHDEVHGAAPVVTEGAPALAPVAVPRPTRKHLPLFIGVGAGLALLIGLVIFFATSGDDSSNGRTGGSGGDVENLAVTIDDPHVHIPGKGTGTATGTGSDTGSDSHTGGGNHVIHKTGTGTGTSVGTGTGTGKTEVVFGPDGVPVEPLTPDDVVAQAQRSATGTERCYDRALNKDPFIKVKSAGAVITVGADGKVSDVALDPIDSDDLRICLVAAIKRWTFRKSTAGITTKLTLKFGQSIE